MINRDEILNWLRQTDAAALEQLWARADKLRRETVGDAVHLRGLIEISNHCVRQCGYCGISSHHTEVQRYRMARDEIIACADEAVRLGYGTVVIQAGEDPGLTGDFIAGVVAEIKNRTPLAVTLSLGERSDEELAAWREAGADRYLLRFETSDPALYTKIHPSLPGTVSDRFAILRRLRELGYETGSGVMIGIPGQTWDTLANDIETFARLDLDMIGVGPFIPHPATPLGQAGPDDYAPPGEQTPNDELTTLKVVALARLVCPLSNIPSTTALATIDKDSGRELGLMRGANVVMPNLTPVKYRAMYEIYPAKACIYETAQQCSGCLRGRIASIGRTVGQGRGDSRRIADCGLRIADSAQASAGGQAMHPSPKSEVRNPK
jgi:biotin synthase